MSIVPKLIHELNAIPIKLLAGIMFVLKMNKLVLICLENEGHHPTLVRMAIIKTSTNELTYKIVESQM